MSPLENNTGFVPLEPEYFYLKANDKEYPRWVGEGVIDGVEKTIVMERREVGETSIIKIWFNDPKTTTNDINPFDV